MDGVVVSSDPVTRGRLSLGTANPLASAVSVSSGQDWQALANVGSRTSQSNYLNQASKCTQVGEVAAEIRAEKTGG